VLGWYQSLSIECSDANVSRIELKKILKIVPGFNVDIRAQIGAAFPDRVYMERGDKLPYPLDCKLPDDMSVLFTPHGRNVPLPYVWSQLRDIVPRVPDLRF
jgi:hypothetical protein